VWTAATVSGFGGYVTTLAIQVLTVVTLHEGAGGVGLGSSARWLPYLLFGLLAGVLVERSRRRPLLIATDLGRGLLLVAVPLLALAHRLSLPVLMGFMAVFGLMSLVADAAAQSFLPRVVPAHLFCAMPPPVRCCRRSRCARWGSARSASGLAMAAGGVGGLIGSLAATRLGARFGGLPVPNRADRRRDCDAEMISVSANPRRSEHQRTCHRRMG
jgi:MFS family permease